LIEPFTSREEALPAEARAIHDEFGASRRRKWGGSSARNQP